MQTGNLTFELAAAVALLVGSKQLVYKQSYRAITNPKLPHKKASQRKLACVQINGSMWYWYPTTYHYFFCRVLTIFQSQETQERHQQESGGKKVKVLLLASNSECLEINKVAEERHTERNKLVNFFLGKQDFAFKLGFS